MCPSSWVSQHCFLSMQDNRQKFIQRLNEDLIGPFFGDNELLFAKPSDNYLTGILYGKSEQIPDEAEEEDNVNGKKDDGDENADSGVSGFRRFRPCAAGLSFALNSSSTTPSIEIILNFGRYLAMDAYIPFSVGLPHWCTECLKNCQDQTSRCFGHANITRSRNPLP